MKRFLTCFIAAFALLLLAVEASFAQTAPSVQARYVAFSNITTSQARASWINGNGVGRIVVIRTDNDWSGTDNALSTTSTAFTDADGDSSSAVQIGTTGSYVIDVVTGATRVSNFSNLSPGTTYYVKVYEYNASGTSRAYKTTDGNNNPRSFATTGTLSAPVITSDSIIVDNNNNTALIKWGSISGASGYALDIRVMHWIFNIIMVRIGTRSTNTTI